MALTKDERTWLDEKFVNLHKRIDDMGDELKNQKKNEASIAELRIEVEKRPTLTQLLGATAVAFGLGISFAALLLKLTGG